MFYACKVTSIIYINGDCQEFLSTIMDILCAIFSFIILEYAIYNAQLIYLPSNLLSCKNMYSNHVIHILSVFKMYKNCIDMNLPQYKMRLWTCFLQKNNIISNKLKTFILCELTLLYDRDLIIVF